MKRKHYWYHLDNAAKVFPAVSKNSRSSVFRLSFYLNEVVNNNILEAAVNEVLPRFETFAVTLKSGLFWYYFSSNTKHFEVKEEPSVMCKYVPWQTNNGYLFSIYYYANKVTLETFHSLSDGTGAMEFLKSIVYTYYRLRGFSLNHNGIVLSQKPYSKDETSDMFVKAYDKTNKKNLKETPAFHFTGDKFANYFSMALRIKIPTNQLLTLARIHEATIGEYVTTLLAFSIYKMNFVDSGGKKPIKMFIPVNLRKFFDSPTLRNFSLYIKVTFDPNYNWDFDKMLLETKKQFKEQLNKEDLHKRMNANVGIEKNIFVRMLPLAIKNLGFKLGYYYLAENINTCAISNLGVVSLPDSMKSLINDIEFSIGGTSMAITSVHKHTNIMYNTEFKDLSTIGNFIRTLTAAGLDIELDTNYREGLDEIL